MASAGRSGASSVATDHSLDLRPVRSMLSLGCPQAPVAVRSPTQRDSKVCGKKCVWCLWGGRGSWRSCQPSVWFAGRGFDPLPEMTNSASSPTTAPDHGLGLTVLWCWVGVTALCVLCTVHPNPQATSQPLGNGPRKDNVPRDCPLPSFLERGYTVTHYQCHRLPCLWWQSFPEDPLIGVPSRKGLFLTSPINCRGGDHPSFLG